MVRKMKLIHVVVYENILDDFNVGHIGIKVKVTIALVKLIVRALWSLFRPKYKTKQAITEAGFIIYINRSPV